MTIIHPKDTHKVIASNTTTIWEYLMDELSISGAVAEIKGRYPEKGFAVNKVSKELAFVIAGNEYIVTLSKRQLIGMGDLIFLNNGEPFAWEGSFTLFLTTTPKFDPKQHIITNSNE